MFYQVIFNMNIIVHYHEWDHMYFVEYFEVKQSLKLELLSMAISTELTQINNERIDDVYKWS